MARTIKQTGYQGVTHNTEQTEYQRVTVQNKQGTKGWLYRVRYHGTNRVPKGGCTELGIMVQTGYQRMVVQKKEVTKGGCQTKKAGVKTAY